MAQVVGIVLGNLHPGGGICSAGESDGGVNPTIDAGLCLPLMFIPFNSMSFEGVVDGENVFLLESRLIRRAGWRTDDGRNGD